MASRSSPHSVSLFPFLAVLVCAMGALILLLLVTTRRLQKEASLESTHADVVQTPATPTAEELAEAEARRAAAEARRLELERQRAERLAEQRRRIEKARQEAEQARLANEAARREHDDEVRRRQAANAAWSESHRRRLAEIEQRRVEQARLEESWNQKLATLEQSRDAAKVELASAASVLETTTRTVRELEAAWAVVQKKSEAIEQEERENRARLQELTARRKAISAEIDDALAEVDQMRQRKQQEKSKQFTILPVDSRSGTTRRPIVIECRKDRFVFVSEGIELTADQLDGFSPEQNPLSAGTAALKQIWQQRDGGEPPYVLLIVRPEGTIAYYIAQLYLQDSGTRFGYELVPNEQELVWPQSDDELVAACESAIDRTLAIRSGRGSGSGIIRPVKVAAHNGQFMLEEVEALRGVSQARSIRPSAALPPAGTSAAETSARGRLRTLFRDDRPEQTTATSPPTGAASGEKRPTGPGTRVVHADARAVDPSGETSPEPQWRTQPRSLPTPPPLPGAGSGLLSGRGITYERDVTITIRDGQVTVGRQRSFEWTARSRASARTFADALDAEVAEWGAPPRGFSWKPRCVFRVAPEDGSVYLQLNALLQQWGLESRLETSTPAPGN